MKKICKECGMGVAGKFCSECGTKFELSVAEQLAEMANVIQQQNKIIEGLQRGKTKTVVHSKPVAERKRQKGISFEEKLKIVIKYVVLL